MKNNLKIENRNWKTHHDFFNRFIRNSFQTCNIEILNVEKQTTTCWTSFEKIFWEILMPTFFSDLLLDCLGWYFLFVWRIFLLFQSPTPTQTSNPSKPPECFNRIYLASSSSAATFSEKLIFELQALFCLCQILVKLSEMV